jgi:hypothetical protein
MGWRSSVLRARQRPIVGRIACAAPGRLLDRGRPAWKCQIAVESCDFPSLEKKAVRHRGEIRFSVGGWRLTSSISTARFAHFEGPPVERKVDGASKVCQRFAG